MARVKLFKLKPKKKGQLFLIEVFIALSVLILLMIALYQVEFTLKPTYQDNLMDIGFNALESLNNAGNLKPAVYNLATNDLTNDLDDLLPITVFWRMSVENEAGVTLLTIYWERIPPADVSVGAIDYYLSSFDVNINAFRIIHMELWRLTG